MPNRSKRFLIIDSNEENRTQIARAVRKAFDSEAHHVIESSNSKDAITQFDDAKADVVIVGDVGERESALKTIEKLRHKRPSALIVAIVENTDETFLGALLRAGARECLTRQRAIEPLIISVLKDAIEQVQTENATLKSQDLHSNEIEALHALYDPSRLYQTARYYGSSTLSDSNPQEFRSLLLAYDRLIDFSMEQQCVKSYGELDPELNRFIMHLGALNAAPRDVIDIHKTTLSAKLLRLTPRKSKACIEESRLLILKVMGELVRYYRALSWGNIQINNSTKVSEQDHSKVQSGE